MRTILAICLTMLTAIAAFAPVAGQQPPGKSKATPPKGTPPPAAKTNPPDTTPATNAPTTPNVPKVTFPTEIGGKAIEGWIKEIDHLDPSVRDHAIRMVIFLGPNARKAIPSLIRQSRALVDLSPQASAIIALGEIVQHFNADQDKAYAKEIKDVVDALIYSLDNSSQAIIRYRAAMSLAQIGPQARAAVPKLASRVKDQSSWEFRHAVCLALGRVGVDEQNYPSMLALNALVQVINDPCKEVRIEALQSIVNLGPPPVGDITTFKNLLDRRLKEDKDKSVQIWLRLAQMRIDPTAVNDTNFIAIARFVKDSDLEIRVQAARALGFIGPAAKVIIPDLIEALKSEEPVMIAQAMWSLSRMGSQAEKALPQLETLADSHKNDEIKAAAKTAIEEIKKKK